MNKTKYFLFTALILPVLLSACRGQTFQHQPVHPVMNMDQQRRFEPQEENDFFADDRAMRMPVKGTVARSDYHTDKKYYQGINDDSTFVKKIPADVSKSFIYRGKKEYNVFCTPCHGEAGNGKGIIMEGGYGFTPAPTYHQKRLINVNDGYIYSVISNGIRNMPSYGSQIPVKDRWAIVSYVRALQRSEDVPEEDLKKYNVDLASLKAKYKNKQAAQEKRKKKLAASGGGGEVSVSRGKSLSQSQACRTCHSIDGSKMTGPSWKNAYGHKVTLKDGSKVMADEAYLTESIKNSTAKIVKGYQPVMPNFSSLSDSKVKSLVEYIKSLSDAPTPPSDKGSSSDQESSPKSGGKKTSSSSTKADSVSDSSSSTTTSADNAADASTGGTPSDTTKDSDQSQMSKAQTTNNDKVDTTKSNMANESESLSGSAKTGKKLFSKYECSSCHQIKGNKQLAPNLGGIYGSKVKLKDGSTVTADDGYIKDSIQYPGHYIVEGFNNNMPPYRFMMTDQQMQAITDYIKSLK